MKSTAKILIVDDEHSSLFKEILVKIGGFDDKNIITARNGSEAIELVQEIKFDLISMDIQMPIMDGLNAIKMIRKIDNYGNTPIILVASGSDRKKCVETGATDYLVKPVDSKEFVVKVKLYLGILE